MDTTFSNATEQINMDLDHVQESEDMEVDSSLIEVDSHIISHISRSQKAPEQCESSKINGYSSEVLDSTNYNSLEQDKSSEMDISETMKIKNESYTALSNNVIKQDQLIEINGNSEVSEPQINSHTLDSDIVPQQAKSIEMNGNSLIIKETRGNAGSVMEQNKSSEINGNCLEITEASIKTFNVASCNFVEKDKPDELNERSSELLEKEKASTVCENSHDKSSEMNGTSNLLQDQDKKCVVVDLDTTFEAGTPHQKDKPVELNERSSVLLEEEDKSNIIVCEKPHNDKSSEMNGTSNLSEDQDKCLLIDFDTTFEAGTPHDQDKPVELTKRSTELLEDKSVIIVCENKLHDRSSEINGVLIDLDTTCEAGTSHDQNLRNELKNSGDFSRALASMTDLSDKLDEQQQQNSELKLQLNALQQAKAALELEISKKEEIIIKTQAESLRNEQLYKAELKHLREELKENLEVIENDGVKELEEQLKAAKAREAKALAEIAQSNNKEQECKRLLDEYSTIMNETAVQYKALQSELAVTKTHLANLESAFSDVLQKYEKSKEIIKELRSNEDILVSHTATLKQNCLQSEERYEALKAHASAQIDKANRDNSQLKIDNDIRVNKLSAIIKRLEIKISALELSLQQKSEECEALNSLCDEVTGKK